MLAHQNILLDHGNPPGCGRFTNRRTLRTAGLLLRVRSPTVTYSSWSWWLFGMHRNKLSDVGIMCLGIQCEVGRCMHAGNKLRVRYTLRNVCVSTQRTLNWGSRKSGTVSEDGIPGRNRAEEIPEIVWGRGRRLPALRRFM